MKENKPLNKKALRAAWDYSYLGIFFGVAICLGYFAGRWADERWGTTPWLQIIGLLVGVASGFRELYRLSRKFTRESKHS